MLQEGGVGRGEQRESGGAAQGSGLPAWDGRYRGAAGDGVGGAMGSGWEGGMGDDIEVALELLKEEERDGDTPNHSHPAGEEVGGDGGMGLGDGG